MQDENKPFLFNDENFRLLKQCQNEIFKATDVSPSFRKMINELVNTESVLQLKSKFIERWRDL